MESCASDIPRIFEVNEVLLKGKHTKCFVCDKDFKLGEMVILAPIQQPKVGYACVMCIPVHKDCYWV